MAGGAATTGVNWAKLAILDDTGALISDPSKGGIGKDGVYLAVNKDVGVIEAKISGIEQKGTAVYANNGIGRYSYGAQEPSMTLNALDMDYDVYNKIKGYESDGKGGYILSSKSKPHVAVLVASQDYDGNLVYLAFANSNVVETALDKKTDNTKAQDDSISLEIDALSPLKDGVFADSQGSQKPFKVYFSRESGFDEAAMYKEVFGGYTVATKTTTTPATPATPATTTSGS